MTIQEYDHSMKHALSELMVAYFPEVDGGIPEDIIRGKLSDLIQKQHDSGILRISIGFSGTQAVGFSIFQIDAAESDWCKRPGWGFIREFYIHPAFRGMSYGQQLANHTEQALRKMGAESLYLTSGNAVPFWERCGWKKTDALCSNGLYILEKKEKKLMASWMVHLRIADRLLEEIPELSETEFVVGNIAPDSGVPNADWSAFAPSTTVSHFKSPQIQGGKKIDISAFIGRYFTIDQQRSYSRKQYSFYLGYLVHLLTDILWANTIFAPTKEKFSEEYAADRKHFIGNVKEDWYDLDYLYLRKHPDFRAFRIYQNAAGFVNTYMNEFSTDAFDNRRAYITAFYLQENDHLDREYPYLTEAEMDAFVESSVGEIRKSLDRYCKK